LARVVILVFIFSRGVRWRLHDFILIQAKHLKHLERTYVAYIGSYEFSPQLLEMIFEKYYLKNDLCIA